MQIFIFFLGLLCSIVVPSSSTEVQHSRRMLHQPLFPLDSLPPNSQPPQLSPQLQPQPQQQPKYPFSSPSPPNKDNTFFPFYSSPPPPPPSPSSTSLATFPANISSIILPQTSSSSKPISRKLVAIAVALSLLATALIIAFAAFLLHYRRRRSLTNANNKASRTDSIRLFPPNTATSDGSPKPERENVSAGTSSEFLYLGTLRGADESGQKAASSSNAGASSMQSYQKLGSPELHPLPPLPRQNFRQKYRNNEMDSSADDEEEDDEEEFFSPTGSSGHKESPPGSSSRCVFMGIEEENLRSRSSNSRTASYPSLNSASPTNSMSSSPLMPLNLSPRSLRSKSRDSFVDFPPPSRPPPAIPIHTTAQSLPKSKLLSPSPPSTPQKRNSGQTQNSPARDSDVPVQYASVKLPPPPPPLPPARFWEIPVVTPSGPVGLQNPEPVSSVEQVHNFEAVERTNENLKPKLKPLHWDKVRASSDRAMVWDQLRSSSFQLNEEMIETLFMVNASSLAPRDNPRRVPQMLSQENRVLDPKKSQNIAILLRALDVTIDEVCEALLEGNLLPPSKTPTPFSNDW